MTCILSPFFKAHNADGAQFWFSCFFLSMPVILGPYFIFRLKSAEGLWLPSQFMTQHGHRKPEHNRPLCELARVWTYTQWCLNRWAEKSEWCVCVCVYVCFWWVWLLKRKGMDTACVYLALADLPGIHTTGTLAAPTPAEFLPIKISIVETEKTGGKENQEWIQT